VGEYEKYFLYTATAMTSYDLKKSLHLASNKEKAAFFPSFFKTGKGQYGEGDVFIGVTVPQQRIIAKKFCGLPLKEIEKLLNDPIHEMRLTGLLILVDRYQKGNNEVKQETVDFYLSHLKGVNNWDLVDSSAAQILGAHLLSQKDTSILNDFAESKDLWKQRIAMVSTYAFIKAGKYTETVRIAEILLHHQHDLIHKAVGWMLREMGKKDRTILETFLQKHAHHMPRTMLRYAIEKFSPSERKKFLQMKVRHLA
jgi:3-methyladenine DNA glycosylase AlkD